MTGHREPEQTAPVGEHAATRRDTPRSALTSEGVGHGAHLPEGGGRQWAADSANNCAASSSAWSVPVRRPPCWRRCSLHEGRRKVSTYVSRTSPCWYSRQLVAPVRRRERPTACIASTNRSARSGGTA